MNTIIAHIDPHTHQVTANEVSRLNHEIGRNYTAAQWTAITFAAGFIPELDGQLPEEEAPEMDPSAPFVPSVTEISSSPSPVALNADLLANTLNDADFATVDTRYGLVVVLYIPRNISGRPSEYVAILADITSPHRNGEVSRTADRNDAILGVYHSIATRQAWEDRQPAETGE